MKSVNPKDWLSQRAQLSEQTKDSPVDVTDRVLETLARYDSVGLALDKTPLVLGGSLLAVAATVMLVLLPSLTTMTEPWISFWLI
ncbi:MAG: hypothetical protein AAF394_09295 [Planctomycetota bacterium]